MYFAYSNFENFDAMISNMKSLSFATETLERRSFAEDENQKQKQNTTFTTR